MTPHEFDLLWRLAIDGALTAEELAAIRNRPLHRLYDSTGRRIANQLRRLVLDPFSGNATTGLAATRSGRRYVGIEIDPEYAEASRRRLNDDLGLFADVEAVATAEQLELTTTTEAAA